MSVRKDVLSWGLVAFVLLLVAAAAFWVLGPQLFQPHTTVRLGDGVFKAQVADSDTEREKGLSGTPYLGHDQALLLVFDRDDKWSIWMKDVNYAIDIVWLNKEKEVVYIVKNAKPESYPYETFVSKRDARYVLELAAGTVDAKAITVGSKAAFDEAQLEGWGV